MTRVRIYALLGAAAALTALAWCAAPVQSFFASDPERLLTGQPIGEALLGVAVLAIGMVFRWAMTAPEPALPVSVARNNREFRQGFAVFPTVQPGSRACDRQGVVIELRRAAARSDAVTAASPSLGLGPDEIARLERGLHERAEDVRLRHVEQARRRFLRAGVDMYGRAPQ